MQDVLKGWIEIALLRLLSAPRATQSAIVGGGNSVELSISRRPSVWGWRVLQRMKDAFVSSILVPQEHVRWPQYKSVESFVWRADVSSQSNNNKENTNATSAAGRMNTFNFYPSGSFASTFGDPSRSDRSPQGSWAVSRTDQRWICRDFRKRLLRWRWHNLFSY